MNGSSAPDTPSVSIIVVSYNTADMTVAALRSVYSTAAAGPDPVGFELIVCDNASSDGSADAIEHAFGSELGKTMHLVRLDRNIGFAQGNNIAAERARGRFILLLNPDTIVLPGAIQALLAFARRTPQARIWGGRTWLDEGLTRLDPASVWRRNSLWSVFCFATGLQKAFPNSALFNSEGYGGWDRRSEREVDIVTGCFLLIDTDLWQALGGFDRRFFMYAEEADLCLRAHTFGARPRFTPDAEIVHFGGASERVYSGKMIKVFAGKLSLAEKHWPAWKVSVARILYGTAVLIRRTGFAVLATLQRREGWRRSLGEWNTVWQRRDDWMRGYRNA